MPRFTFLGVDMYLQTEPTFKGAKCPVVKKVPYTADKPTLPQRKARAWLARMAFTLRETFGTSLWRDKEMPNIAIEIGKKAPGKGIHGGKPTLRDYAIARRVPETRIAQLEKEAAITVPA